ncbi:protein of unknown function [Pseudarcicella hirudinis]|uniref:DUF3127 domain-containing protein n=1 Tax=Pseudarcicella hirudinis TaxID=1079859 RepID=A0A1I5N164_9BACT|nr:DUF3127 domain-containing protein [Pseudarcicella hirudinis]SFP15489.1 protein of unknown function [Pseudarcicella hirudinis]
MALEVIGKLIKVLPEVTGQGRNGAWVKQEFVLETQEQYPKKVCMAAWGDKTNELRQFALGDTLKASISIESREYNERWYTEVRAFRIDLNNSDAGYSAPQQNQGFAPRAATQSAPVADLPSFSEDDQDLPF